MTTDWCNLIIIRTIFIQKNDKLGNTKNIKKITPSCVSIQLVDFKSLGGQQGMAELLLESIPDDRGSVGSESQQVSCCLKMDGSIEWYAKGFKKLLATIVTSIVNQQASSQTYHWLFPAWALLPWPKTVRTHFQEHYLRQGYRRRRRISRYIEVYSKMPDMLVQLLESTFGVGSEHEYNDGSHRWRRSLACTTGGVNTHMKTMMALIIDEGNEHREFWHFNERW